MLKKFRYLRAGLFFSTLLLVLGCDDKEEKQPEVEIHVPKGVEVKVKRIDEDEMVIVAELIALSAVTIWALFGPGARRRWSKSNSARLDIEG